MKVPLRPPQCCPNLGCSPCAQNPSNQCRKPPVTCAVKGPSTSPPTTTSESTPGNSNPQQKPGWSNDQPGENPWRGDAPGGSTSSTTGETTTPKSQSCECPCQPAPQNNQQPRRWASYDLVHPGPFIRQGFAKERVLPGPFYPQDMTKFLPRPFNPQDISKATVHPGHFNPQYNAKVSFLSGSFNAQDIAQEPVLPDPFNPPGIANVPDRRTQQLHNMEYYKNNMYYIPMKFHSYHDNITVPG